MSHLLWHGVQESAEATPDRTAVDDGDRRITYGELDDGSSRLASFLRSRGIGPGDRVALHLPKSCRAVVCMVGVLKAGAAYVPVDPNSPGSRARTIVRDARPAALLTDAGRWSRLSDGEDPEAPIGDDVTLLDVSPPGDEEIGAQQGGPRADGRVFGWKSVEEADRDAWRRPPQPVEADPAYILYTSGSTGRPKGVVVSHRNAITFVEWGLDTFRVGPEDRLSNHAPLHFDLSVFDVYCGLYAGARVCMVPGRVAPFPRELARWIADTPITVWYSVPSALVRLLKKGDLDRFSYDSLHTVLFAGEVFPVKHLRKVMEQLPQADFYNLYGPTETNVCTYHPVPRPLPDSVTEVPIGRACENTEVFAVDDDGARVTDSGRTGELLVRGPSVMLGYWGLPERTDESLVQNPLHDEFRDPVFRTGDLVELDESGDYLFRGRRDHMVKTRGYRVELGEIEHALHEHGQVRLAAAVALPDDEIGSRLFAAVVPEAPGDLDRTSLERHLRERLPRHAVPERITVLDEMPRTSTGKTDRRRLKEIVGAEAVPEPETP